MTQTLTDNGSALGAGSVNDRFNLDSEIPRVFASAITEDNKGLRARIAELEAMVEKQKETILRLHAATWY